MNQPTLTNQKDEDIENYIDQAEKEDIDESKEKLLNDNPDNPDHNEKNKSSKGSVIFNMINGIIGSGIIGLPFGLAEGGVGGGSCVLFLVALITTYSLSLLIKLGTATNATSYPELSERAMGKVGKYLLAFFQYSFSFGVMVAYMVIIGDNIPFAFRTIFNLPDTSFFVQRHFWIIVLTIFPLFPLSIVKNISRFAKFSILSITFVFIIVVACFCFMFPLWKNPQYPSDHHFFQPHFIQSIGMFSFSYMCHPQAFMLSNSLKGHTMRRWNSVTVISVMVVAVLYSLFAFGGYFAFFEEAQGNILNNFSMTSIPVAIARLIFSVTLILTFPLYHFACRETFMSLTFKEPKKSFSYRLLGTIIDILNIGAALTIALFTSNVGIIMEISGTFSAIAIGYIIPGLCSLFLRGKTRLFSRNLWLSWILVILGIFLMFVGTFLIISDIISPN